MFFSLLVIKKRSAIGDDQRLGGSLPLPVRQAPFANRQEEKQRGFTLIELMIVVAITVTLTTIVALNFQALRAQQELHNAANDLISQLREIQNFVLAGKIVPGTTEAADEYEINFTVGNPVYQIDYKVGTPSVSGTLRTVTLPQNIRLNQIVVGVTPRPNLEVEIESPFGEISVSGPAGQVVRLELMHQATSRTRSVIIDTLSGRIER